MSFQEAVASRLGGYERTNWLRGTNEEDIYMYGR